ncbi:hypothetical protein GCM10009753_28700 [Streptantibioticus ferralitis]
MAVPARATEAAPMAPTAAMRRECRLVAIMDMFLSVWNISLCVKGEEFAIGVVSPEKTFHHTNAL